MFYCWQEIEETNCTYEDMIRIFDEAKLCGIKERWFSLYKGKLKLYFFEQLAVFNLMFVV